ncbi:MAG: T9SS type A sorting domain-containing protein [Ignavibacteriales bacterium]|nr:T9SS type A sorting domain-containing protein [Ignavibacteriales bacterium]
MKNHTVFFILVSTILLGATTMHSQTRFLKYEGNPVLKIGSWDDMSVEVDRVFLGDTLKMWYTGWGTTKMGIGYAFSTNGGITWTKRSAPILSPTPGAWDGQWVSYGYVLPSDSGYRMWYSGKAGTIWRIGYATATSETSWTKRPLSVLDPGSWNLDGSAAATVVRDSSGGYKMWYQGMPAFAIGYATSTNETTWTANTSSVFSDGAVYYQRVIFDGQLYRMWYTYHGSGGITRRIKYATSTDGINWTIPPDNPVLGPGPTGAWDEAVALGDVQFDGNMYHLWYRGFDGSKWQSGYAVSPKGLSVNILPARDSLDRTKDTIRIAVRIAGPQPNLSFSVKIESPDENPVDTLKLFDDGAHGDSLANDGLYGNIWIPDNKSAYYLDLAMTLNDTLRFEEINNIKAFLVTSVLELSSSLPRSYELGQNYPNPFNPSTEIQFSLPQKSHVTLTIFDLLGREVATLVSEQLSAGSYSTRWDAAGMPSGVYFYRLTTDGFVETKKLILMR